MKNFSILSLLILYITPVHGIPECQGEDDLVKTLPGNAVSCESEFHPSNRRIFRCPFREQTLLKHGIHRDELRKIIDPIQEEHLMVKAAIQKVVTEPNLAGVVRAILWEDLSALIQKRIEGNRPVSRSYRGEKDGVPYYIFQGIKIFDQGKVFVLIISEEGDVHTGLVNPIEDLSKWEVHLNLLKQLGKAS